MTHHPELPLEQAYLDRAYAHLARMRARTKEAASLKDSAAQGVDSAIAQAHLNARLRTLDTEVDGLTFGRLDAETATPGTSDAATWRTSAAIRSSSTGGRRCPRRSTGPPPPTRWSSVVAVAS